jgi:hypothetical protein
MFFANIFIFVYKKHYVPSVFFEFNFPVGKYEVSNVAKSEILRPDHSFTKTCN